MTSPTPQISAAGLTDEQLQFERTWLTGFAQASESLDWSKWETWWTEDAFLQFGNSPRVQGKDAIAKYHEQTFTILESLHHEFTRYSFDVPLGLIYQSAIATFRVKGDPQGRAIQVPGLSVIHKGLGENVAKGCEIYIDNGPVIAVVQEVLSSKAAR